MTDERVDVLIQRVVSGIAQRVAEISNDLRAVVLVEIPALRGDPDLESMLTASIQENVAVIAHFLEHRIDLSHVEAPTAALEYARRLAQRGIPTTALVRAYRLCHARFVERCLEELGREADDVLVLSAAGTEFTQRLFSYVDVVSEQVTAAHERERERWLRDRAVAQQAAVISLLAQRGSVRNAEAALRYVLDRRHQGLLVWSDARVPADQGPRDIHGLARGLGGLGGGSALLVQHDEWITWVWVPVQPQGLPREETEELIATHGLRGGIGDVGQGAVGFRATHRQAQMAHLAATLGGPASAPATWFADVGALALLGGDLEATRGWVRSVLGPLSEPDERAARLRETLRVFLELRGSYTAAGNRLMLHKNTVQYRVQKAVESLGRPWEERTSDLELALRACEWFGNRLIDGPERHTR